MREMKDSKVKWLGEIPLEWKVERVKHGFIRKKTEAHQDNPIVLSLARTGVKERDISNNEGQIAESYYNYNPVDEDDLLINPMDLYSGANCSISKISGVISPAYVNLRYREGYNPQYYDYYFKLQYWLMAFFAHGKGVSYENRWTLTAETLMNYPIIVPIECEQRKIVDYLDSKCLKIDKIIEKQQAIIEKLKEYKLHLIQETVTKGLDRNAELRESGEIWIGKVPKHWAVLKLKSHTRMITPMRDKPEDLSGDIPWVRIEDYNGKYIDSSREGFGVSEQTVKEMNLKVYPVGSILCTSSCDLGKCAIVATPLVSNQRFINIVPDEDTSSDYLYYVMLSNADRMNHLSTGTIQANLSRVAFEHLLIQFPPLEEQKEIARYLDHKVEVIDSTIMGKEKLVEKLREYKKSLIYEVVTGKKEV